NLFTHRRTSRLGLGEKSSNEGMAIRAAEDAEGAKRVIEGFESNFDLNTLRVQIKLDGNRMHPDIGQYEFMFMDNMTEHGNDNMLVIRYSGRFNFVVENGKNGEHAVEVIYGDGLMSIKDEFIPDY